MINFLEDNINIWDFINGSGEYSGTSLFLRFAIIGVSALIVLVSIFAFFVSCYLGIKYFKFNRRKNSAGLTGKDAARKFLDAEGLQHIKVSATGSILFGNSYSHYFKKVRLRRLTWKKDSISSLAMAAQKSSLAVLDKEGDPDMRKRIKFIPLVTFGPLMFIPLIIVGVLLDLFVLKDSIAGIATLICSIIGLLFYLFAFILSILELKTEKKAQVKAIELLRKDGLATEEELEMMKDLFHLYNIEYVNNMILALLELIYRILKIVLVVTSKSSSSSSSN